MRIFLFLWLNLLACTRHHLNSKDKLNKIAKITLVGMYGVGKSSIFYRLQNPAKKMKITETTLSPALFTITRRVQTRDVKAFVWDTAGQERFGSLTEMYTRDSSIVLVVFDVNCLKSFECAKTWIAKIEMSRNNPIIILLGNKSDLVPEKERTKLVLFTDFASSKSIKYFNVSANANEHIFEALDFGLQLFVENTLSSGTQQELLAQEAISLDLNSGNSTEDGDCCSN